MTETKPIKDISEIRNMMEKASRVISLSGLSGVFAGFYAIIGAALAHWYFHIYIIENNESLIFSSLDLYDEIPIFVILLAALVFTLSVGSAVYFTTRNSKKKSLPLWDNTTKKLLINLFVPLFAGGIFILVIIYKSYYDLVVPASLIFYGLALLNGGHFTYKDIRYLGYLEIVLGFVSFLSIQYDIIIWSIGFGLLHIIYGVVMYYKYER
ncbi:MAG: hypothetical protein B6I20_08005 [Bacteroidetes bacterium 4572_117]|nr:MAG: hypothetical protein B6I20_08005 [Bacteroidetes bacterium 4572_117]